MANLTIDSTIVLKGKQQSVSQLVETLIYLPSKDIINFFDEIGLNIPRVRRMSVFRNVLFETVMKTRAERESLADELNYRLSWFRKYSEYEYEKLLVFYNSKSLNRKYLETLWVMLLDYMIERKVDEKDIARIINKSTRVEEKLPSDIFQYNYDMKDTFFDLEGELDGLSQDVFRPVLYKSSTLPEIRELGLKHGVKVPKRLRKKELLKIILEEAEKRNLLTKEVEEQLHTMTIMLLQRYAKDNKIKVSIELKKEEIIEYILSNAKASREHYFLPSDRSAYELEIKDIKIKDAEEELIAKYEKDNLEEIILPVREEPVVEEVEFVEEVVEQKPEETVVIPVVEEKIVEEEKQPQVQEVVVIHEGIEATDEKVKDRDVLIIEEKVIEKPIVKEQIIVQQPVIQQVVQQQPQEEPKPQVVSQDALFVNTSDFETSKKPTEDVKTLQKYDKEIEKEIVIEGSEPAKSGDKFVLFLYVSLILLQLVVLALLIYYILRK